MTRKIKYVADQHHKIFHSTKEKSHYKMLRKDKDATLVEFASILSAIEMGYKPCPSCFREYYDIDIATKLKDIQDRSR